ncbi:hypothetical protein GCM10008937_24740 [Deinococcus depolymerans]|uniref:Uncharacterized protein n=1 Tax=Deinococcus depolymerans TaxID=392408 RepID=A0ABN1CCL5_9DEIO
MAAEFAVGAEVVGGGPEAAFDFGGVGGHVVDLLESCGLRIEGWGVICRRRCGGLAATWIGV